MILVAVQGQTDLMEVIEITLDQALDLGGVFVDDRFLHIADILFAAQGDSIRIGAGFAQCLDVAFFQHR